ncbi:MAG: chemotaxis protein CheX [Chromatiales bacterium]|nr:chemotaxis protein CheX [Chromatiales bacterium]
MNEADIAVFIDAAEEFFRVLSGDLPIIGETRIEFAEPPTRDYTGLIQVGGIADGAVWFTADEAPLGEMLRAMHEDPRDQELKLDLIGELAGTVVMNVRERFGTDLRIEVPRVYAPGHPPPLPDRIAYVVPLLWGNGGIDLVIALNFNSDGAH